MRYDLALDLRLGISWSAYPKSLAQILKDVPQDAAAVAA
jgi:hypothetical protein